ncbi:hypothetical protein FNF28_02118 [Cafeteria roenbergensis]|uniref:Kinesin-like protein n=1 Tax=Cafeteria roenbergensis TaxID=33653 RepID=A0A5A8DXN1_CAFRO|nr:hypothetical protein FNF28_02118 [Cafeteria roenbergensis]
MAAEGNIKVYCRVRPLLPTERDGGDKAGFLEVKEGATVVANQPLNGVASSGGVYKRLNFDFDDVFDTETTQEEVFDRAARSVVEGVMDGYHGTIFAYGQSGSGKTHTMQGPDLARLSDHGIGPRSVYELFRLIEEAPESCRFTVRISCVEIYMERVRDLLDLRGNNLSIRQDPTKGVFVSGAREEYVASPEEMLSLVAQSAANRVVSATGLNTDSSRSHAVTTVTVEIRDEAEGAMRVGKLSLVDLAGSEMVRKTLATGLNLEEAKIINKSLSALGNVIKALAGRGSISSIGSLASTVGTSAHSAVGGSGSGPRHVPYRDSKLTRLLQDSLGGNCRTALIICASDNARHGNETLSTLRFGARASRVQNHAVVNRLRTAEEMAAQLVKAEAAIDAQAALIQQLKAQLVRVTRLAAKLNQMRLTGTGRGSAESEAALQEGSVISAGSPAQQSALPLTLGPAVMPQLEGSGRIGSGDSEPGPADAPTATDKARLDATASRALAVANDAEYAGSAAADVAAVRSAGRHLRRARAEVAAATLRAADDARDSPILPDADSQAALAAAQAELGAVFARLETSSAEHPAVAASIESVLRPVAAATNAALPWSALPAAGASTAVALQAAWAHLPSGPQRAATGSPTALPEAGPGPGSQGAGGDTATSGDMAELLALLRDHAEALGTSALRLSSLTAVNRQLARKFAVADSELSGLTGAIRARDRRIAALVAELRDALGRASRAEEAAATARSGRAGVSPYDGLSESDADTDASAATSRRGGLSRRPRATSSSRERHVRFAGQAPSMRPTLAHDGHVIVPLAGGRTPRSPADVGAGLSPQRTSDVAREASFLGRSRVWPGRLGDDDDAEAEAEDERAASDVGAPAVARAGAAGRGAGGHRPQAWYSAGEPAAPAGARPASPVDAGSMSDGSVMSDADGAVWTGVIVKPDTGAPPAASGWIDEDSD